MVLNIKVYKKCSDSGKITLYMGKREFVDTIEAVEPIGNVINTGTKLKAIQQELID